MSALQLVDIVPDPTTQYLVGPKGLVWRQPKEGPPYIIAARTLVERQEATEYVGHLVGWWKPVHGLPLVRHESFESIGRAIGSCFWVPWTHAPAPAAEDDGPLPSRVVIVEEVPGLRALRSPRRLVGPMPDSLAQRLRRLRAKAHILRALWRLRQWRAAVYCLLRMW